MNDTVENPKIPAFVLVRPQMGENIGAAARAMWNFGLDRMRIVAPRDGWPNPSAVAMASGAGRLLDEAVVYDAGLENEDIARANAIVSVPVNPQFASLNLAQCVLLMGYEWMRAQAEIIPEQVEMAGTDWADNSEIEHLARHFEERLDVAGFFYPEHKAASMKINLRNMWSRLPLTRADVQTLHGTLRQMVRWKERG